MVIQANEMVMLARKLCTRGHLTAQEEVMMRLHQAQLEAIILSIVGGPTREPDHTPPRFAYRPQRAYHLCSLAVSGSRSDSAVSLWAHEAKVLG